MAGNRRERKWKTPSRVKPRLFRGEGISYVGGEEGGRKKRRKKE